MTITERRYDDSETNPLYPVIYMTVPGTDDFQLVAHFSDGGGYDWTDWAAWFSPAKRAYFIASGSGCSCNSLTQEFPHLDDFETVTSKPAVLASLRAFVSERYEWRRPVARPTINEQIAEINSFRPKEESRG